MKSMLFLILLLAGEAILAQTPLATNTSAVTLAPEKFAAFRWTETTYNFGFVAVGKPVTHQFEFTNEGNTALIIQSVRASCGCTVTNYTKDPVLPGGKGTVSATYNAANPGVFNKTLSVLGNVEQGEISLTITGTVVRE